MKWKPPRRPLVLAVTVATIAAVLSGALETTAQADASAPNIAPCPDNYFSSEHAPGVELCLKENGSAVADAQLLVANLSQGAKLRVVSDRVAGTGPSHTEFRVRHLDEWDDFIRDNEGAPSPPPSRLAFITNAGFFIDVENDTTPLSLPEIRGSQVRSYGYAVMNPGNPAWRVPKMGLMLSNPGLAGAQDAMIAGWGDPFTGAYTNDDVDYLASRFYDVATGFPSHTAPGDVDEDRRRTAVFDTWTQEGDHLLYIMKGHDMTLAEMSAEITAILGYRTTALQLDGGMSGGHCWVAFHNYCNVNPIFGRPVPQVLAVYSAVD